MTLSTKAYKKDNVIVVCLHDDPHWFIMEWLFAVNVNLKLVADHWIKSSIEGSRKIPAEV